MQELARFGWRITSRGGPALVLGQERHASWAAAWGRPWLSEPDTQVQVEVNCNGTPERALARLVSVIEAMHICAHSAARSADPGATGGDPRNPEVRVAPLPVTD
jgi:hypothetical protein